MLENTKLDYISTHTRKSILTSTNPSTDLLDLHRNIFQTQQSALVAGTKLKSNYKNF